MRRVLIAGCGYLGTAVAELFHANDWSVEGWTASADSAGVLAEKQFAVRVIDISDLAAVQNAATAFDAVIQCVSSRGGGAEAYRRVYLAGARNLATCFPAAVRLFTSSTSVYAQRDGEWVTELSPAEPQRESGRVLRETEEVVLAGGGIVARLGGIYGPGRSALLRKFLAGTAVIDARSTRFVNQAHRDDIASAIVRLVEHHHGPGPSATADRSIFNISDNHPLTERACYEWLAEQFNRPLPPTTLTPPERKRGDTNKRVSAARLQALGWSARYADFPTAMTESILPSLPLLGA